jgi:molecular chaperone HscB
MSNYFEFYGLPEALELDEELLKKKFYAFSRSFHPDFHTLASAEDQENMLLQASLNNVAYKTLASFESRLKHLLTLHGKFQEDAGENKVPQQFLMEMMELNEGLIELEMDPTPEAKEKLLSMIAQVEQEAKSSIAAVITKNLAQDFTIDDWELLADYFLKSKYLLRLRSGTTNIS